MIYKFTQFFIGLITCSFLSIAPLSAQTEKQNSLQLKNRFISLNSHFEPLIDSIQHSLESQPFQIILKFDKQYNAEDKLTGIKTLSYLGQNTYLCLLENVNSLKKREKLGIIAWANIRVQDKISAALHYESKDSDQVIKILVKLRPNVPQPQIESLFKQVGAIASRQQLWKKQDVFQVQVAYKNTRKLAASSNIIYVQPAFKPKALNVMAEGYTNTEIAHQPISLGGYNLLGNGVTVGVGDNSNPFHVDYNDRIRRFSPSIQNTHGIHTVGTVAGNGIKDQRYRGFAPECSLISDYFNLIIANAPVYYDNFGMVATNNSYAMIIQDCNYEGTYDIYSNFLDQQAINLPKLLNLFAAGNDGNLTCGLYPPSYATVVGAYSTAKNVLTVGAIGLTRDIEYDVFSRGPVKDGRLKPEITAMGYHLMSTGIGNTYVSNSGTSMSTPNVTGGSALLYQRYRQLHNNQTPANALIKLVLMNGADDIANPGPDYHYGFGLLNIGRSLAMLDSNQYFSDSIQTSEQQTFSFSIPQNMAVAKIMLYWNDPAASPLATNALVNDLDVTVSHSGNTYQPLILNPNPSHVADLAIPGADHRNNVEQVTLQQPTAGVYTINIDGYDIPQGPQKYYVAYSFIPNGIAFQYPFGGEALISGDSTYIYWQASDASTNFSLSFSTDNGSNWQTLAANIPADKRAFLWHIPPTIHSSQCLLKINRGSESAINKKFMISGRTETALSPTNTQCPGSVHFSWHPISGISQYAIFKKSGIGMTVIANTNDTFCTISGLSPDSLYWIAVASKLNNTIGIRSVAFSYQPNQGNCAQITEHGDLRLSKIISPQNGRLYTQSSLSATSPFKIQIQNLDNLLANNYTIHWQVNNGIWQSQNFQQAINPASKIMLQLPSLNLSNIGDYRLKVSVSNNGTNDPISGNDTLKQTIRQLDNPMLTLDSVDAIGFENFPDFSEIGDTILGIGHSNHWDFASTKQHGRIRSFVNSNITMQGNRSISMDNTINEHDSIANSSQNYFTGTFNLSAFDAQHDEVRCDFDYLLHGLPKFDTGNQVWLRGNENDAWLPLYKYQVDSINPGSLFNSGSLSLSDALASGGQHFSTATQIRFCQRDTSLIAAPDYGNGLTMDNFNLYVVHNDIQLLSIDSLFHFNCALSDQVPLKIKIYNSVQNTVYNIPVTFKLDNMPAITETIDSIMGKDSIVYQFQNTMDLSSLANHTLSVWCAVTTDSYKLNDSIMNFTVHNQPIIDSFPYLQNFEQNNGYFYSEGNNSSWQYGTPASPTLDHAASGQKAWKTNLSGSYHDNEFSFLYSPCYDISQLQNPMLSFSLATDIETNPSDSAVYDEVYVEYSTDGLHWQRLQSGTDSYNWYNNPVAKAWTKEGETWWHVSSVSLPQVQSTIAFRFVMKADPGASFEGVAIDDIHIYDLKHPIFKGDSLAILNPQNILPNNKQDFFSGNDILAQIFNSNNTLNNTSVQRYQHENFVNADSSQYFLPENFVIKSDNQPSHDVGLSLYVLGDAMKKVRNSNSCPSCAPSTEIYRMGISQYIDKNKNIENRLWQDNKTGQWQYIPWQDIQYIPYDKGYEIRFKVNQFSELWLNNGGPNGNAPFNQRLFTFQAKHLGKRQAQLLWSSMTDAQTTNYFIQRADSNNTFHTIGQINSIQQNGHQYQYIDTPILKQAYVLYRIAYQNQNGYLFQSLERKLEWSGDLGQVWIYPNPISNGKLTIGWLKSNDKPLFWQFYDNSGRLIQKGKTGGNPFGGITILYLGKWGLASGLYLMKVSDAQNKWHFKIIYRP